MMKRIFYFHPLLCYYTNSCFRLLTVPPSNEAASPGNKMCSVHGNSTYYFTQMKFKIEHRYSCVLVLHHYFQRPYNMGAVNLKHIIRVYFYFFLKTDLQFGFTNQITVVRRISALTFLLHYIHDNN